MAVEPYNVPLQPAPPVAAATLAVNELLRTLMDPSEFMKRLKVALMGKCEWFLNPETNGLTLGEWVFCGMDKPMTGMGREIVEASGKLTGYEKFVIPPINPPLVKNSELFHAVESYFYSMINGPTVLSRPEMPDVMANIDQWSFSKYLYRNWERFGLDSSTYHALRHIYGQVAFAILTGASNGDNKRWMASFMTVSESRTFQTEAPKEPNKGITGIFK